MSDPVELAEIRRQYSFHLEAMEEHEKTAETEMRTANAHRKITEGLEELYPELLSLENDDESGERRLNIAPDALRGQAALEKTVGQEPGRWYTASAIHAMLVALNWAEDNKNDEAATRSNINRAVRSQLMEKRALDGRTQEYAWVRREPGGLQLMDPSFGRVAPDRFTAQRSEEASG